MTFEIETLTKAHLEDVRVLSQKNRQPDENPGVQLPFSIELSNHILSTFDGALKSFLFTKNGTSEPTATKRKDNVTGALDGVEVISDLPKLSGVGSAVKTLNWDAEVTGGELAIHFATTQLLIDDCKAHSFRIKPKEGGTVQVKFIVDAPNASEKVFAKLAKYKSREVEIAFVQHEPAQRELDDDKASSEAPPQSATTEAVPDATETFVERSQPGTRTARGRDTTAKALADKATH